MDYWYLWTFNIKSRLQICGHCNQREQWTITIRGVACGVLFFSWGLHHQLPIGKDGNSPDKETLEQTDTPKRLVAHCPSFSNLSEISESLIVPSKFPLITIFSLLSLGL